MGIITQPARALSQHVFSRASNLCAARLATSLRRVSPTSTNENNSTTPHRKSAESRSILSQCRSYATATVTATVKTPGRPKAHTGRTAATKKKAASTTTKKPAARTEKPGPKPRANSRAKAKPKSKPRRRVLTEKQKEAKAKLATSQKLKNLKAKALLTAPKGLPATAWQVLQQEQSRNKSNSNIAAASKEAASIYKSLTPEERERLNHTANENKANNETAHKQWLLSFTAKQIKEANTARAALKRQSKVDGGHKRYSRLQDDRLVKLPMTAYTFFFTERNASGDMNGMKIGEIGGLVAREWKALSNSDKKTYENMAEADKKRYLLEHKTVYGEDAPVSRTKAVAAA